MCKKSARKSRGRSLTMVLQSHVVQDGVQTLERTTNEPEHRYQILQVYSIGQRHQYKFNDNGRL